MLNSAILLKQIDDCENYFWSNENKFTNKPYENINISVDDYGTDRNDRRAFINCGENVDKSMGDLIIIKCIFMDSYAGQQKGGAISIEQNCEVIITETIFIRCYSVKKGGALYLVKYSIENDYDKGDDKSLKKTDIQYCCFQDCFTLKESEYTSGVALYSSATNTTLLYDSTINCSDTEVSDGAQFDLQAEDLMAKYLNVTGGKSKACCGVHVRRANKVSFQYHGMNKMECKWGTMISINSCETFEFSTCNYVSNKIGRFEDHSDKNGALIFIDNIGITIDNCYFMNTEYFKGEDKIIEKANSDPKITLTECYIDKEDKNRLQNCETSNCHFDNLFTKYLFDYLILGECGRNATFTSFFTDSNEFSETNGFSKTNDFSESNRFSFSSKFSSSGKFTETDDFSKSTYFSSSGKFSNTDFFTKSEQFSKTIYFTSSRIFTNSDDFDKTIYFTKSNTFSQSNYFSFSDDFSESNDFSKSSIFTETNNFIRSNQFSKTSLFTNSGKFTSSFEFTKSAFFEQTKQFSFSNFFTNSIHFLNDKTYKFTGSNSFTGSLMLNETEIEDTVVNNSSKKQTKIKIGMIIGIVVGVIALLIIILLIVLYINKKKNFNSEEIEVQETISSENAITFNNPIYNKDDKGDDPFMEEFDEIAQ